MYTYTYLAISYIYINIYTCVCVYIYWLLESLRDDIQKKKVIIIHVNKNRCEH